MNVMLVADSLKFGGGERHLVALATGLAGLGHAVTVAYLKPHDELAAALRQGGVGRVVCCGSRGKLDLKALQCLAALAGDEAVQVMVATSQYALMYCVLARLGWRLPAGLVFISHSMDVVRRTRADRLRFFVYRRFYALADCMVFVSGLQRRFFGDLGVVPRRAEVIHNGIDLAHFADRTVAARAAALRTQLGLDGQALLIGMCAIFRDEKRQVDLLAALARLRARGIAAKVLLVGDGATRHQIEACRDALGLDDAVLLCGFQQDVRPYVALCDVMVLASAAETFPMATLEYMAMGKPLVASDVGGMGEQVGHGVDGLLYPPGDVGALADALAGLADPALRARLGAAAAVKAGREFDLRHMVLRYQDLLKGIAHAH